MLVIKALTVTGCVAATIVLAASPAGAEVNTADVIESGADAGTRPAGVCFTWGTDIPITTVYEPGSSGDKLVTVALPRPTSVKAC